MDIFEIIWRGAVLLALAFLAWTYFMGGVIVVSVLLVICVPVWIYITLYSLNYI